MAKNAGIAKTDTAVKLVLMFFISLLSFSVGTYVGKQFSDNEAQRAALEADYNNQNEIATQAIPQEDTEEATAPISDEEVASLTEEYLQNERSIASTKDVDTGANKMEASPSADKEGYTHRSKMKAESHEQAVAALDELKKMKQEETPHLIEGMKPIQHTPTAHAENKKPAATNINTSNVEDKMKAASERVAHDMAPEKDMVKPREPSSVLPTVATTAIGKYTVQVASYSNEKEAKEHASQLMSKGYSAFFVPAIVNGKSWYRVSVGLFSDQKSASSFRAELLSSQSVPTAIVQKIVK